VAAAQILKITFLDHVIVGQAMVGGCGFFSFRQAGLL
jgi:DNA repair protein RadC